MALAPYFADMAVDANGKRYVTPAKWDQMMDNFINWKFNVNGGGNTLSNVILSANSMTTSGTAMVGTSTADGSNAPLQVRHNGSSPTTVSAAFDVTADRRLWIGSNADEVYVQSLNAAQSAWHKMRFASSEFSFEAGPVVIAGASLPTSSYKFGVNGRTILSGADEPYCLAMRWNLLTPVFLGADSDGAFHVYDQGGIDRFSITQGGAVNMLGHWQHPVAIGGFRLWHDTTAGVLRYKDGIPGSISDGIPV